MRCLGRVAMTLCRAIRKVPRAANAPAQAPVLPSQPATAAAPADPPATIKPEPASLLPPQPKRILGVMPNFRAVSTGTTPPPPTAKQAFVIATQNSFHYSGFVFADVTSAFAEWTDAHPHLAKG